MKIYKRLGIFIVLATLIFSVTACSESANKCDSQVNNKLIKSILNKYIFGEENQGLSKVNEIKIAQNKSNEKKPFYATMMNNNEQMDGWSMLAVMSLKKNTLHDEVHEIKIHSYLTLDRDKEFDKVECAAIVDYKFSSTTQSFDILYTSQPSDKEEGMFVKITSLKKKN